MEPITSQDTFSNAEIDANLVRAIKNFPIRHRTFKRWLGLLLGIFLVLISIVGTAYLAMQALQKSQIHSWAILVAQLPLMILLVVFVLPLGIGIICYTKRHWDDGLIIYEQGFIKKQKKRSERWLWSEIECLDTRMVKSVFGGSEVNSRIQIEIEAEDHSPLKIKHRYDKMVELAQIIRKNTVPILYQKKRPQLSQNGAEIFHKNLELSHEGLIFNQSQLDWNEINAIETQRGVLSISARDQTKKSIKIPLNQISNLDLLLFIVHNPSIIENLQQAL
jgi:hypothetical protein